MKLTYRGIKYKSEISEAETQTLKTGAAFDKYRLGNAQDSNKVILIRPMHYYTYRGVSYTKNLVFDTQTKLLLNIDRQ